LQAWIRQVGVETPVPLAVAAAVKEGHMKGGGRVVASTAMAVVDTRDNSAI